MVKLWPPDYQLRRGHQRDRQLLLSFLEQAYQEQHPHQSLTHLQLTLEQYWSEETPVWFVEKADISPVACLWLGNGYEQVTGDRYTHIFLLYVAPQHRRLGLGQSLVNQAEQWAKRRGDCAVGLEVFVENKVANLLYAKMGYQPRSTFLLKSMSE